MQSIAGSINNDPVRQVFLSACSSYSRRRQDDAGVGRGEGYASNPIVDENENINDRAILKSLDEWENFVR